ncbi:cyclic nucleotide-binding protein [Sulfurovum lithotrophicum]|uniref:Cyclic nucleotide-binding protein n=2 Tax=Sulfurovum lithotrophicum TaxID=206403 RepID=A0A7U4M377_9BACT|nr:cyclic nucleotide-binding protein [Sulfurovum lithotrophicum]
MTVSEISRHTRRIMFKKGETLFTQGELIRYFYVVIRGKIKSYQLNLNNAKEQTIFIFREGDMFDTIVLLDGKEHDVMYEALEESEVLQMPIEFVRELISTNKEFNSKFFPYLARQMRQMEELATDLSLFSTSERLIKLLLQNLDPNNLMKYNLIQGLSHTEIAKLIGTVRHVVERHLKALKADGTIETKNKNIQIVDTRKLLDKINLF